MLLHKDNNFIGLLTGQLVLIFSYVTLSTPGYGDITPISPFAKTLSFMQAVIGQLDLTIMVARLNSPPSRRHQTDKN